MAFDTLAVLWLTRGRVLSVDEPLAPVDVVGRAGNGGVDHELNGEGRDVGRSDDAPDRQGGAQLVASALERCVVCE